MPSHRGKSGKEGFLRVDRDYILDFATKSKEAEVKQFHLLSGDGANADSYFLYLSTKGMVDNKVIITSVISSKVCLWTNGQ